MVLDPRYVYVYIIDVTPCVLAEIIYDNESL